MTYADDIIVLEPTSRVLRHLLYMLTTLLCWNRRHEFCSIYYMCTNFVANMPTEDTLYLPFKLQKLYCMY